MSRVTSLTAVKSPNLLVTFSMRMYAGAPEFFHGARLSGARSAVREISFTVFNMLQSLRMIAPTRWAFDADLGASAPAVSALS